MTTVFISLPSRPLDKMRSQLTCVHPHPFRGITVHPTLPYMACVGLDRTSRVFNLKTGKLAHTSYLKQRLSAVLLTIYPHLCNKNCTSRFLRLFLFTVRSFFLRLHYFKGISKACPTFEPTLNSRLTCLFLSFSSSGLV
jgi:WD40 repeat protein